MILFLSMGFCMQLALAQEEELNMPIDLVSQVITYQEVVDEDGTQDELFNRGSTWLRIFYANPIAVSKVRDQASGVIRGQHQIRVYHTDENGVKQEGGMVIYNFKIECKDDRYRYTVDEFVVKKISRYPLENWMNKQDPEYSSHWGEYLKQIDTFVKEEWVPSLKANMKPEIIPDEKEW